MSPRRARVPLAWLLCLAGAGGCHGTSLIGDGAAGQGGGGGDDGAAGQGGGGSDGAAGQGGGGAGGSTPDARGDVMADRGGDANVCTGEACASPDGFDRSDCARAGFAAVDLSGIWTTRYTLFDSTFVTMHRFALDDPPGFTDAPAQAEAGGMRGWLAGLPLGRIVENDGTLYWSRTSDTTGGSHHVTGFLGCQVPSADVIDGKLARCIDGACDLGTFHAVRLGRHAGEAESSGIVKLAEFNGAGAWTTGITVDVKVSGAHAFVSRYQDGLRIVDVSKAADGGPLTETAHVPAAPGKDQSDIWNDVKILDDRWVLNSSSLHGLVVVDAADRTKPKIVVDGFPGLNHNVHTTFLHGTRAYLSDLSLGGVDIVDMSDPTNPLMLGTGFKVDGAFVHDLYVDESDRAYLCSWNAGLVLADMAAPAAPKELGRFTYGSADMPSTSHAVWKVESAGRTFVVLGDEDFGAHVRIVDVDPASPAYLQEIGSFKLRDEVSVHNIKCVGTRCYVVYYQDGLRVLDVADPTNPTQIAYYNTWTGTTGGVSFYEGSLGIDVVGGLIYVGDSERGLLVLKEAP